MCNETQSVKLAAGETALIDGCIAEIVESLQSLPASQRTMNCCCGHGDNLGVIFLQDGRAVLVLDKWADYYQIKATGITSGKLLSKNERVKLDHGYAKEQ